MFKGHNFVKLICDNWVFDMTEFIGYKVIFDKKGNIQKYTKAFEVSRNEDNEIQVKRFENIPVKVIKEVNNLVKGYIELREA